jgi:autotransporter-associated beta strand protein
VASASSCTSPNASAFTSGSIASFCTAAGTGIHAAITISGMTVTDNTTLNTAAGVITNQNNSAAIIDVAAGKQLECYGNFFGNLTTASYIKNGDGTLAWAGGTYTGGFTLNAGMLLLRGNNAMGQNANSIVTINSGTIAATSNGSSSLFNKFGTLVVGGDFQMGISSFSFGLNFNSIFFLGSTLKTITLGNGYPMLISGVISNSGTGGIAFSSLSNALGRFEITNTANTFTGSININGSGGAASTEVRFQADGSLGNVNNSINLNGGKLATIPSATFTISSTHGINVGNIAGSAISVVTSGTLTYNGVIADLCRLYTRFLGQARCRYTFTRRC